ncbi:hypothetical protein BCV72DRAFT_226292 [Rhizopus microsporus var. microsporus]|uniref:Tyr recombinase domain-containing protein n=2 Tax=Rhizopus microsporus TaxID=58291 RepID=A0A2G4SVF4_RHIZD|nr:uncharacterized protein RHIMIDRAFT_283293 [Rhizopus microsporus ATCC 52813]ORE07689.1 hypothetical protein BCV72DRAFT_226292 [Rhizopus microsporus var. microsporus]PHZ12768.1 hypothetical protein RHIMIDRAFT_283293 [Rhizopus microsporus ATCC 52813]
MQAAALLANLLNKTPSNLYKPLHPLLIIRSFFDSVRPLSRAVSTTATTATPTVLTTSVELNRFIQILKYQAPPVRLHRPTIELKPTFNYISSLDGPSISLSRLQMKLAFLLGVTCFLRPSDLHRIPFSSTKVTNTGSLYFEVHCPKEKRKHRRIIKSVKVKEHYLRPLCPVTTYQTFNNRRRSDSPDTLFLHSYTPLKPLSVRTIQR